MRRRAGPTGPGGATAHGLARADPWTAGRKSMCHPTEMIPAETIGMRDPRRDLRAKSPWAPNFHLAGRGLARWPFDRAPFKRSNGSFLLFSLLPFLKCRWMSHLAGNSARGERREQADCAGGDKETCEHKGHQPGSSWHVSWRSYFQPQPRWAKFSARLRRGRRKWRVREIKSDRA